MPGVSGVELHDQLRVVTYINLVVAVWWEGRNQTALLSANIIHKVKYSSVPLQTTCQNMEETTGPAGQPIISREKTAPFLIRTFVKIGSFHRLTLFEDGTLPTTDEQQLFAWYVYPTKHMNLSDEIYPGKMPHFARF